MPLSNVKLNLSAFTPLIDRTDRYLGGWQASLLNYMGRAVLVNSVLDSALIYTLSAMQLPQGTIDALDKKRRAFLWSGEATTIGARCLVAWEQTCLPKELGGLGIKNLQILNQCLLLKHLHRLHHPGESAWAKWVSSRIDIASLESNCAGAHWKNLQDLLPIYRAITTTTVGNGLRTSFWFDHWLPVGQLSEALPSLFSHTNDQNASVAKVYSRPLRDHFVTRLSHVAAAEFAMLEEIVEEVVLQETPDNRLCPLVSKDGTLRAGPIYAAMMSLQEHTPCPFYKFVWINCAPPRVRFFAWLLVQEKIQCKTNLVVKKVVENPECEVCHAAEESPDHLILHCHFAKQFWTKIGVPVQDAMVSQLWLLECPVTIPVEHYSTFLLLCAWQLWKHRHDVVFRGQNPSILHLLLSCKEEARLWSCRLPRQDKLVAEAWCNVFSSNM